MPNWIGDCVMALPTVYKACEQYDITLIAPKWLPALFPKAPFNYITLNQDDLIQCLQQHPASDMLLLTNSLSSARLARKGRKQATGYRGDWRRYFLYRSIKKPKKTLHESQFFLYLYNCYHEKSKDSFIPKKPNSVRLPYTPSLSDVEQTKEQYKIESDYILICPFAEGKNPDGSSKIWSGWEQWIIQNKHSTLIACPGPGEDKSAKAYRDLGVEILSNVSLRDYLRLMTGAAFVIGNDTGPMHLAAATNPNSKVIFTHTGNKERCKPIGNNQ